jgi:SAM-dependent methyltransferase
MRTQKDEATDQSTKRAWEKNWEEIKIPEILEIFNYVRVKKQMEILLRVLPKNEKILEGGCGLAPYLIRLRQLGYSVEGIDYNESPIKKVLEYDPSLPVSVGDVSAIPHPDKSFGAYISLGVIEHFTEGPQKAIREACRILKPGGVFFVMVPRNHLFMRLSAPVRFLKRNQMLRKLLHKPADTYYWEQYFKKGELAHILESEGFRVAEIHPLDHSHALVSFSSLFRDKSTFDEANPFALKCGEWFEK